MLLKNRAIYSIRFHGRIVCVRHGQEDSPLTPRGITQAQQLASALVDDSYDVIISSPLGRTMQTAEILAHAFMITEICQDSDFAKRNEGELQGLTKENQIRRFPEYFDAHGRLVDIADIPGGEPLQEFLQRVQTGLSRVSHLAETKRVIVVTHTGVLQAIVALTNGVDYVDVYRHRGFDFAIRLLNISGG